MAGKKRVSALMQRFAAAQSSTKSFIAAAGACDASTVVVEGSVEELIALYNGMACSLPDFPRSAYTRSTCTRAREPPIVVCKEQEPQEPEEQTLKKDEAAADDEEEEPSTCDETASIHSLSSSFMSDSSFDDHASEASLYYESEYFAYRHQEAGQETEAESAEELEEELEEGRQSAKKRTTEPSCGSLSLEPDAEPATVVLPPPVSAVDEIAHAVASAPPEPEAEFTAPCLLFPPSSGLAEPVQSKPMRKQPVPKMPRALLSSKIPIREGSSLARAVSNKAIMPLPAAVSGGSETSRPFGGAGSQESVQHERCVPSVPRNPVKREVCRRFAAASSPSPRKQAETRRKSDRRHSIGNFKPKAMAPPPPTAAPPSVTVATNKKKRSSVTAPSARFQGTNAQTSFVDTEAVETPSAQPKFTSIVLHHPTPINSRATATAAMRTRESHAWPPIPPSGFIPIQNAETRLDRIKSRLFDYENDPKRLEIVAANRARRKNLEARAAA